MYLSVMLIRFMTELKEFISECCDGGVYSVAFDGYRVIERSKSSGITKLYKAIDINKII